MQVKNHFLSELETVRLSFEGKKENRKKFKINTIEICRTKADSSGLQLL